MVTTTNSNPNLTAQMGEDKDGQRQYHRQIVWRNVLIFASLHSMAAYGLLLIPQARTSTLLLGVALYIIGGLGITAGAHRLWSHRSYKANRMLKVLLAAFNTVSMQNDIYEWCRDHRVHHKYSDTDADPHNSTRGFFFSHIGWLLVRKHPQVIEKGKKIDLSDLKQDDVVMFQKRYYKPLTLLLSIILPTVLPHLLWSESLWISYFINVLRYVITLNVTWQVNSSAHKWGYKPYDHHIKPAENYLVSLQAFGEGFHNYHRTFPNDYATSEFGAGPMNMTKLFIDFMAWIGWASDRTKMSEHVIRQRRQRTGDYENSF